MRKRGEVDGKRHSFLTSAFCEVCGQLHDPAPLPTWKSPRYPVTRRMVGSQSRSGNYEGENKTRSLAQPLNRPRHPHLFLLGLYKKNNLRHKSRGPGRLCAFNFIRWHPILVGLLIISLFWRVEFWVPSRTPVQHVHPHLTWHPLLTAPYRNPTDFPIRNSLGYFCDPFWLFMTNQIVHIILTSLFACTPPAEERK